MNHELNVSTPSALVYDGVYALGLGALVLQS